MDVTTSAPSASFDWQRALAFALPILSATSVAVGGVAWFSGHRALADQIWNVALIAIGTPVVLRTVIGMLRGTLAADVVAMLAIVTAVLLHEPFAGMIVVLMQTGGEALDRYAEGRASAAVRELEAAAPRVAHRRDGDAVVDITVDEIRVGDALLVRPGEMIPCDGVVQDGRSDVDVSRLTGEPIPALAVAGVSLPQGAINGLGPLTLKALKLGGESQYARIVQLVRTAQSEKAPIQRVADRYAVWFTPLTLVVCALAWWYSGDVSRVLAVLVVATPCPLILAVPVAIIGGVNRAARRQIIVRTGGALEQLSSVTVVCFDKTGTLTIGRPKVQEVQVAEGFERLAVLRLAGAVEMASSHLLARTLVEAAVRETGELPRATDVVESPGYGVEGTVEGRRILVGSPAFLIERYPDTAPVLKALDGTEASLRAAVAIDGKAAALVRYADEVRPGIAQVMTRLQAYGVKRTLLLSGDHTPSALAVASTVGIREALGDLKPEDKVREVQRLVASGERVLMVGDGTNDAPALAAATVGVALAADGGGISAEAADAVILVDDLSRVADAVAIGQRTLRITRQSIGVGLGLSGIAMIFAALGMVPPAIGALLQEAIDVAVILNAVRTAGPGSGHDG